MKLDIKTEWRKNRIFCVLALVALLNFAAHLCVYPLLPAVIPTHWDADGVVNGHGPKAVSLLLSALPLAFVVFFRFLPSIDPKAENYNKFRSVWNTFVTVFTLFMAAISWLTELAVFGLLPESSNLVSVLVFGGCGLLFIILGNYMPRIRQNYSFGCKTPWALADEHNWNRTQRMGGIVFIVIGAAMLLSAVFARVLNNAMAIILVPALLGGTAWIYLYSFLVFRGKMK